MGHWTSGNGGKKTVKQSVSQEVGAKRLLNGVFVRHTFSLPFMVFLPPLPEVQCPKILDIRNPWGKLMDRSGLRFEHFSYKFV